MGFGILDVDGIPGTGNRFGSVSSDVETSMQKWATRSEDFKGSGFFGGDAWRASKMAKSDSDFSLASSFSSADAHMLRFSSSSKLESSALPYFHQMEAAQYKNSGYYSSGGLDNSSGVYLLSGVRGPFTPSQWLELEQQALIYKHIIANEPIPIHLLISIRKAFESAGFYSLNGATLKPTSWGWGPFHVGYSNNTDPEPGRCRRTDGKKWRCSRDAGANQKYCEKHMNRGRHRSRKHVEGQVTKSSTTKPVPPSVSLSNNFDVNQHQHFQGKSLQPTTSNPNMNASLNRMVVNREESSGQKLQDATQISFLSQGINLNCSGSSFTILNHQLCSQEPALNGYGSYTHVPNDAGEPESQNSPCTFLDDWHKNQSSADFMSSTSSPTNEKAAVGVSPLRLSQEHEIGLGFGSGNWKPITWEASMGGPLAEALQSSSISNNTTDGIGSCQVSSSSPNGVLQRSTPVSLSNSSAGSSPRADNSKTMESGGSLSTGILGSGTLN